MDKNYQDLTIYDKHFLHPKLVIPRGCHIISIFFDIDVIRVHYVDINGLNTTSITYDEIKNVCKLVID